MTLAPFRDETSGATYVVSASADACFLAVDIAGCMSRVAQKFKNHSLCRYYGIRSFMDFPFSRNQPLKSAGDQYVIILKNE
jgi:hypothetical protein